MALNFPNSPTNGQLYTDTLSGNSWTWDSANTCWKSTSTYIQTITVSSSAPGTPAIGQLWWNRDYGRLLVYYSDGDTSQWVDASPSDYTSQLAYNQANAVSIVANTALANTSNVTFKGNLYFPNGSVGIGTTLASYKLHVENAGYCEQLVFANSNGGQATYRLKALNSNGSNNHILIGTGVTDNNQLIIRDEITNQALYMISNTGLSSTIHKWYTNNNERMRIDSNGYITTPNRPAFHVYDNTGGTRSTFQAVNTNLTSVVFNVGNLYNTSTCRFTAPVAGKYYFYYRINMNNTLTPKRIYIMKNGAAKLHTYSHDTSSWTDNMAAGMIDLAVNDYVEFGYYAGGDYGEIWNYAGGYLLG